MQQDTPGKRFEEGVIGRLRRPFACDVRVTETMDRIQKIDGEIRSIKGKKLLKPVQVQVTRRIDHYGKLKSYLSTRPDDAGVVSLYVEVRDGIGTHDAAEHIAWAADEVQRLEPYGDLPTFGLRIDDDAVFFDPYARLLKLEAERLSPERSAALKTGTVYAYREDGFWIMDPDGISYFAQFIDVFSRVSRRRLRDRETGLSVRFLPRGKEKATDIRLLKRP